MKLNVQQWGIRLMNYNTSISVLTLVFPISVNSTSIKPVARTGNLEPFLNLPPSISPCHSKFYHLPDYTGIHFIDVLT